MRKKIKVIWTLIVVPLLTSCLIFTSYSFCQEMPKPGEVINKSNYKEYAHLFPKEFLQGFEDGFGGVYKPFAITVARTIPAPLPKRFITISDKNRGKFTIDAEGFIVGGFDPNTLPFPGITPGDKDFGVKLMWNLNYTYTYDDLSLSPTVGITKRKGEPTRRVESSSDWVKQCCRLYVDPKPVYPNNSGLWETSTNDYTYPSSIKHFGFVFLRYIDQRKANDTYMYIPQMRRVLRGDAGQTSTPLQGSIQAYDDFYGGFYGKIQDFTYRYVGEQKVLAPLQSLADSQWMRRTVEADPGYVPLMMDNWEVRDVYVIEIKPKAPNYPQSRKMCYLDKEQLRLLYTVAWDRAGKVWKLWVTPWKRLPLPDGDVLLALLGMYGVDMQFGMGSGSAFNPVVNTGIVKLEDTLPNSMLKRGM